MWLESFSVNFGEKKRCCNFGEKEVSSEDCFSVAHGVFALSSGESRIVYWIV